MDSGLVTLDPEAQGEIHFPLDFSPWPDTPSRSLFPQDLIDRHLDHLAAGQQDDGGWIFNWTAWAPAVAHEWRGAVTVHALKMLHANGRLHAALPDR